MKVWRARINDDKSMTKTTAFRELIIGALFFAMQSCKYSTIDQAEHKKTKLLTINNICFFNTS